ncbi:hypothetical protein GGQ91_000300 [Methylobacterium fujisawaense]|uniref:Uncharacterized protein n=1 Tax=Methylobacterium fujisawaense TaxID=107400 RepID=A0ABR6D6E1_9HYPH|nr:hypothetical protein [Methylobacterium fujisawaense]MBA9060939.1 hypothetical protein [Methylobacterium fujisawaense]
MTMEPRLPGRTTRLDQLGPGSCYLIAGPDGPDLALVVLRDGRREALLLNRRHEADGHLRIVSEIAPDADVLALRGAFLAPSGALADIAVGHAALAPAALHLGDGRAYLCGCDRDGRLAAFDVGSGRVSAMDPGDLPRASRWRVMVPEGNGVVTVYAAEPA